MTTFRLSTPPHFKFWPTVISHGWCDLPPFRCDERARTLERIQRLRDGSVVRLTLREDADGAVQVFVEGLANGLSTGQEAEIAAALSACLNLDRDLDGFYALVRSQPRYAWIEAKSAGRLLSSPTVWEDLVKTLFTTNTTWNVTKQVTARFVTLGESYSDGGYAFPTPERIAAMRPDDLNARVRAGYRGAYLHELAIRVASGEVDVESWRDPALSSPELYKRIKSLKGFGDYAAGNLLRLLGHFDRLATDTVCRDVYQNAINGGVPAADDREISAYYEPFGIWRGLAQWMDVMESDFKRL